MARPIKTGGRSSLDYYQSLESMEGVANIEARQAPARATSLAKILRAIYPGAIAAATIGLAATWLSQHYGAPVMLFSLLLGMAFHFLHEEGRCVAGIEFCSRSVLRVGVALLGARITAAQIGSLGFVPIATVLVGVATTTLFGVWLARRLKLGQYFGILSGGAVAICGASAALAISTALPTHPERERDTVLTVVGVTTLSTVAMVLYPDTHGAVHFNSAGQAGRCNEEGRHAAIPPVPCRFCGARRNQQPAAAAWCVGRNRHQHIELVPGDRHRCARDENLAARPGGGWLAPGRSHRRRNSLDRRAGIDLAGEFRLTGRACAANYVTPAAAGAFRAAREIRQAG